MIVNMIQGLGKRMEVKTEMMQEMSTIDLQEPKNKQTEMNNTIIEIENTLEGTNSKITEAKEWISELEDRMVEIIAEEQNKGKGMKTIEESLKDLWDPYNSNVGAFNIVPKEEEKKKGTEKIFE